jgi:hypothetical protein
MRARATLAALVAIGLAAAVGCRSLDRNGEIALNDEVLKTIRANGAAPVLVTLRTSLTHDPDAKSETEALRVEIARVQDEVLASLEHSDFRLRHRFATVPALSGTVLSERGLRTLSTHPLVDRLDLDEGGGGASGPVRKPATGRQT